MVMGLAPCVGPHGREFRQARVDCIYNGGTQVTVSLKDDCDLVSRVAWGSRIGSFMFNIQIAPVNPYQLGDRSSELLLVMRS